MRAMDFQTRPHDVESSLRWPIMSRVIRVAPFGCSSCAPVAALLSPSSGEVEGGWLVAAPKAEPQPGPDRWGWAGRGLRPLRPGWRTGA